MSNKTVRELAEVVGIPLERLLEQLAEAGLKVNAPDEIVDEEEKTKLLAHLRKRHGKVEDKANTGTPTRVTLKQRKVSELKQASVPGSSTKVISVEVRKKKTFIKRTESTDTKEKSVIAPQLTEKQKQPQKKVEKIVAVETIPAKSLVMDLTVSQTLFEKEQKIQLSAGDFDFESHEPHSRKPTEQTCYF